MATQSLFSFDVFDTVISRTYAAPEDLLFDLGERLRAQGLVADAESFLTERVLAEREAWDHCRFRGAVAIETIYRNLARRLAWPDAARERAMAAEIALEKASARIVPPTAALLAACRRRSAAICFVSDMHLRGAQLRDILQSVGACEPQDKIYASSDWNVTKVHRGALFRRMLRDAALPGWRVAHVGDHPRADVLMARAHLLRARLFRHARLTGAEQRLLEGLPRENRALRKLVVASKFTRLRELAGAAAGAATAPLCDAIAPFVTGYALWLLARARRDGVSKLFFLARDMQVVCKITALLARRLGADVECVYTHASRAAWQPAVFEGSSSDFFWLTDQLRPRTPRRALARLLDAGELAALERGGVSIADAAPADLDRALRELVALPQCRAAIDAAVERRRRLLLGYLAERGFAHDGSCALVDAGWRGSLQRTLSRALARAGTPAKVRGYYVGLRHAGAPQADSPMHAFLDATVVAALGYSLVALTEAFLTADHGTTLGYTQSADGSIAPLPAAPPSPQILGQAAAVESACTTYAAELFACLPIDDHLDTLPAILARPFTELCARPLGDDAAALCGWLLDAGRDDVRVAPLARAVGWRDAGKIVLGALRGRPEADLYLKGPWVRGSLALTNPLLRLPLEAALRRRPQPAHHPTPAAPAPATSTERP